MYCYYSPSVSVLSEKDQTSDISPAEKKPPVSDWTSDRKIEAISNCVSSGNPQAYCDCSVDILVTVFSYSEFKSFDVLIRSGAQPDAVTKTKMIEMSKRALSECK